MKISEEIGNIIHEFFGNVLSIADSLTYKISNCLSKFMEKWLNYAFFADTQVPFLWLFFDQFATCVKTI